MKYRRAENIVPKLGIVPAETRLKPPGGSRIIEMNAFIERTR
jgi:hypothetical protein